MELSVLCEMHGRLGDGGGGGDVGLFRVRGFVG
jgi:hypothetical protein